MSYEQTALPWKEAEEAFVRRGLMTAEEFYAMQEELRGLAFTIKELTSMATMAKAKRVLEGVIRDGGTLADWFEWAETNAEQWSRAYAELVYRMATLSSYNTGRYMQMNDPDVVEEFGYLMYDAIDDDRTREEHAAMDGRVWARDDFPDEWWPPAGYNCRCAVRALNEGLINRLGKSDKVETDNPVDSDDDPLHPDEGFRSNQSEIWAQREALERELENMQRQVTRS